MPRMKKPVSKSMRALFAKTLYGAPTPWIGASWISDTGADVQVKFRLWIRRRGRTLHVETHPTSALLPGRTKPVRLSRHGSYDMHHAGLALVNMCRWDPDRGPADPRALWNPNARDYALRLEYVRMVSTALPQFLTPTRGRPRVHPLATTSINPAMPVSLRGAGRAAARRKQRNDLLVLCERVMNLLTPMLERTRDARALNGYIAPEQGKIARVLNEAMSEMRGLREAIFYDRLHVGPTPTQAAPPPQLTHPASGDAADWELTLDSLPTPEVQ